MRRFTHLALVVTLGLGGGSAIASHQDSEKPKAQKPPVIEAVLESVDVKARTITVRIGKSIDEVLTEKLRERTRAKKEEKKSAGEKNTYALAGRKVEILIQFRSSPSVANHVEHPLADLEKMISYPVALETSMADGKTVVSKIVAYRGTPWKLVDPK